MKHTWYKKISTVVVSVLLFSFISSPAQADSAISVGTTTFGSGIATNVGVNLTGFDQTQNYQVTVKFVDTNTNVDVTNGTLTATQGSTSLVAGYLSYSAAKLGFKGSYAAISAALSTMTWNPNAASGDISIRIGIATQPGVNEYYDANSVHYYKYVSTGATWSNARIAAENTYLFGLRGYLAEINSAAENNFVGNETSASNIWIGATEDATTTTSYTGSSYDGSPGKRWIWNGAVQTPLPIGTGEIAQGPLAAFSSWAGGEPNNDAKPGKDCAVTNWGGARGMWNDLTCETYTNGYLIEFGGRPGETSTASTRTLTTTVVAREAVTLGTLRSNVSCTFGVNCSFPLSVTNPTAKNSSNVDVAGTFAYTSSNEASTTVSAVSGGASVALVGAGSSTITATFTPTNTALYASASKTFTITVTASAPAAPTELSATSGNSEVALSWTPGANGGSSITDYLIQYSTNNSTWSTFSDGVSTNTSTTVTGLNNGTLYYFRVSAINSIGTGTASASVNTTPATSPDAPTALIATLGNAEVALSWTPGANGGSSITDYLIQYSTNNSTWTTFEDGTSTTAAATVTGLDNGTLYYFRVAAINSVDTGNTSESANATPATSPAAPIALTATAGNTQVVLSWTAGSDGGTEITDYLIEYSIDNLTWATFADGIGTETSATVIELPNGTPFYFRVSAINAIDTGIAATASATPVAPDTGGGRPTPTPTPTSSTKPKPDNLTTNPLVTPTENPLPGSTNVPAPLVERFIDDLVDALKPVIVNIFAPQIPNPDIPAFSDQDALDLINSTGDKKIGNAPSLVLYNNEYQPSKLAILDNNIAQVIAPGGGVLNLQAKDGETPIAVNTEGRVQMVQSNFVFAQGTGLAPNSEFAVYLFSNPTLLGVGKTNAKGEFFVSFPVKKQIPLGDHTLQVNGLLADGRTSSVSMPVSVVDSVATARSHAMPKTVFVNENPVTKATNALYFLIALFAALLLFMLFGGSRLLLAAVRRKDEEEK